MICTTPLCINPVAKPKARKCVTCEAFIQGHILQASLSDFLLALDFIDVNFVDYSEHGLGKYLSATDPETKSTMLFDVSEDIESTARKILEHRNRWRNK